MRARREVEIRVRLPKNSSGTTEVLALLAQHQLPTLTRSCIADREGLVLLLTTGRLEAMQQVLKTAGYHCQTHPVVLVGPTAYRPGAAARLLAELGRQGVTIRYSYLTAVEPDQCFVVVETTDDERTLQVVSAAN